MTKEELTKQLTEVVKKVSSKDKKAFLDTLKEINKKADKLDSWLKNIVDGVGMFFVFGIDGKIVKVINDISENIENPKLDASVKIELEKIIVNFLTPKSEEVKTNSTVAPTQQSNEEGKKLWEETKKVRKAL
ncbi:MAG: hypothetical protein LBM01_03720 [Christensenellaceae bacterium]|jgi:hypothetical protein|nr:hypothetical protein [Christensenellaceae bacterium]